MRNAILFLLSCMSTLTIARPDTILDFEGQDHQHKQEGEAGNRVEGSYSWTSPEGDSYYVKYVADENGYRVVESNVVPVTHDGVKADGNQGAFGDKEGEAEGGEGGRGSSEER